MSDKVEVQTLDVLIDNLKQMRKDYGNLPLIYCKDDEGNGFDTVKFTPTPMMIDKNYPKEFDSELDNPTHLCIN